jgi:hypothetical protein
MAYVYSVLRFVPDPGRAEFINIGAVAGDEHGGDWTLRLVSNLGRARAIDDRGALGTALSFLGDVEARIAAVDTLPGIGPERMSRQLLAGWTHDMQNVLQFTPPTPVVASSADDALDLIFEELVLDPATRRFRFEKKHRSVAATANSYRAARIPEEAVSQRVQVTAGKFHDTFDFAVHNGSVAQLVRCWSFQLPAQDQLAEEVKAWGWVVEQLRSHGGEAFAAGRRIGVRRGDPTDLAVVYIPPAYGQDSPAYDEAREVWRLLNVTAVIPEQADVVAHEAARRLQLSSGLGV